MNIANYSPYNKSYRFILFQNQAYHQKNKRQISPCIKSNIKYPKQINPETFSDKLSNSSRNKEKLNYSDFIQNSYISNSMIRSSSSTNSVFIDKEKRVIHKNQSYEKFRTKKINQENSEIVNRLLRTSCQVIKKDQTQKSFNNHLKYRDIRKKYTEHGLRKSKMCLGNSMLLCPTLAQYQKSGLGEKFVELDLSMSMAPSTASSRFRKRRSPVDYENGDQIVNQA